MTDRSTLEPFFTLPLTFHHTDVDAYKTLARFLSALKAALDTLDAYYKLEDRRSASLVPHGRSRQKRPTTKRITKGPTSPEVYYIYPYPTECTLHDGTGETSFTYEATMNNRSLLFKGKTSEEQRICVKFVRQYGFDVHIWFADKGCAPKLIASKSLPGGWSMVVMDLLDESWVPLVDASHRPEDLKDQIHGYLVELHQAGMVHGDLRDTNILVRKDGGTDFMVVDYDWAGSSGEVRYPPLINKAPELGRPGDVEDGLLILTQHDLYMLDKCFPSS